MKVSAWLVIELTQRNSWSRDVTAKIAKVRQTRPLNELAVKITLDFDPNDLQPHVEALADAGLLSLVIEEPEEVA
jgi:hypothetical protein